MSIKTRVEDAGTNESPLENPISERIPANEKVNRPKKKKRKRKVSSQVNIWIRRIHLYSGLFMLPWVLLYGFTALLFNHPTYMTDSKTEIQNFSLAAADSEKVPAAETLARLAVETANAQLVDADSGQKIELAENPRAIFTRQAFGSVENDEQNVSVIMDLNKGTGYLRKRTKEEQPEETEEEKEAKKKTSLENGLKLALDADPVDDFKGSVTNLLAPLDLEAEKISMRSLPNIEFDAIVDGKPMRLKLAAQQQGRGRRPAPSSDGDNKDKKETKKKYSSQLSIVGSNPREMSARSFLLRLHMAHGYGVQTNARWFWAIAVDLMFASMCFWGLSGVVMWWQIKRTRRIGFILLVASAVVATWLAIGMHWQLVNG